MPDLTTPTFQLHKPRPVQNNPPLWPSRQGFEDVFGDPDNDSGICSPPMWMSSPSHSPTSRTQAIVRGQRELMEMVKSMPESNYELSLKDLVEHHHKVDVRQESKTKVEQEPERNSLRVYKREGSTKNEVKRNGNFDRGGFYLKLVFPFFLGSKDKKKNNQKKKKKNESSGNTSSNKVSPKPDGSAKTVDKEWWKKSHLASRDSDSGGSSINSGSLKSSASSSTNSSNSSSRRSNSRRGNRVSSRRCWPLMSRRKTLTQK